MAPSAETASAPSRFALRAAWPNPAVGSVNLAFSLPRSGEASLKIYDVAGRLVRVLHDGAISPGETIRVWDGRADDGAVVSSGIYFYRMVAGDFNATKKTVLIK